VQRSLTARLGLTFAPPARARARTRRRAGRRGQRPGGAVSHKLAGLAEFVWQRRRLRVALLALAATLALLAGGWLWLRNSSLAAVRQVHISGVQGVDAGRLRAELTAAARGTSTLNVNVGALEAAVAPLHLVRELHVSASFPHTLRITVVEQPPVADLLSGDTRTPVAADGVVLGRGLSVGSLPSVRLDGLPPAPGGHVHGATLQAELAVLGAAPRTLLGWVQHVWSGHEGLTVTLRGGLEIYFGNSTRPHAKWLAAARVLADPRSAGASYVDVSLPERPAAGSDAPGGMEGSSLSSNQVSASDPSAAALAATLDEAVSGGSPATAPATAPAASATGTTAATSTSAPATSATGASGEPPAGAAGTSGEAAPSATGGSGETTTGAAATTAEHAAGTGETASTEQSTSTSG
jgi:cell division protein FtsQ